MADATVCAVDVTKLQCRHGARDLIVQERDGPRETISSWVPRVDVSSARHLNSACHGRGRLNCTLYVGFRGIEAQASSWGSRDLLRTGSSKSQPPPKCEQVAIVGEEADLLQRAGVSALHQCRHTDLVALATSPSVAAVGAHIQHRNRADIQFRGIELDQIRSAYARRSDCSVADCDRVGTTEPGGVELGLQIHI